MAERRVCEHECQSILDAGRRYKESIRLLILTELEYLRVLPNSVYVCCNRLLERCKTLRRRCRYKRFFDPRGFAKGCFGLLKQCNSTVQRASVSPKERVRGGI